MDEKMLDFLRKELIRAVGVTVLIALVGAEDDAEAAKIEKMGHRLLDVLRDA